MYYSILFHFILNCHNPVVSTGVLTRSGGPLDGSDHYYWQKSFLWQILHKWGAFSWSLTKLYVWLALWDDRGISSRLLTDTMIDSAEIPSDWADGLNAGSLMRQRSFRATLWWVMFNKTRSTEGLTAEDFSLHTENLVYCTEAERISIW